MLTISLIILFILLVCAAYQNDRLNKIEEVQKNIAGQLPYMKSLIDLDHHYISGMKDEVHEIHKKMFKPREKKNVGYIPKLPDEPTLEAIMPKPKDFYSGLIPYYRNPFDLRVTVSTKKDGVGVFQKLGTIKLKKKVTTDEALNHCYRLLEGGKLRIENKEIYRSADLKETSLFYFKDSDGKKVDGRGKGPRDAHGRFTVRKEKKSKPVFNKA